MSSGLHARHPFTPQRSPPMPSSQSSHSPPSSEGGGEAESPVNLVSGVNQGVTIREQVTSRSGNGLISGPVFSCWTYHQSHKQITVLFYVPKWAKEKDVQIAFGKDYLIAGMRQSSEKVIQAQLAGQIDPFKSHWNLEKQSKKRRRSHKSGSVRHSDANSNSDSHSSDGGVAVGVEGKGMEKQLFKTIQRRKEEGAFDTVSPASITSSETSSFDMVAQSVDNLDFETRPGNEAVSERMTSASPQVNSPRSRLDQSMTLSEEGGYISSRELHKNQDGSGGVQSLESSISFDPSQQSSSSGQNRSDEIDDPLVDAKLVTLHLCKIDEGNWQEFVSGPASLALLSTSEQVRRMAVMDSSQQLSLSAAVSEALGRGIFPNTNMEDDDNGRYANKSVERENESDSFTQSTTTVNTISSDDSTTVLGVGGTAIDEEQYEMDGISLALLGLQHAKQGHSSPFPSSVTRQESRAFEYFKRSWRKAEVPMATKRLVENYLPPLQGKCTDNPSRKLMIASLGGPTALARLYVSYARLHLPSYEELPLAFPSRDLNNPYSSGGGGGAASPRSQTSSSIDFEPIILLREAYDLDKNVAISHDEWEEAQAMDSRYRGEDFGLSKEEGSQVDESDQESHSLQKRDFTTTSKRRKGAKASKMKRKSHLRRDKLSKADPGLYYLVGSTALLSVVVAGGVAMAGWWRRTAAAGGGIG